MSNNTQVNISRVSKWLDDEESKYWEAVGPNEYADGYNDALTKVISNLRKKLHKEMERQLKQVRQQAAKSFDAGGIDAKRLVREAAIEKAEG